MFYGRIREGENERFKEILRDLQRMFPSVFAMDNLIALGKSAGFLSDERFRTAVERHAGTRQERSLLWRLHTLAWAARNALSIPGDFVECGVWRGFCSAVVTTCLDFASVDKTLYLYDTFRGIPDEYNSENRSNAIYEHENRDDPHAILKRVRAIFEPYPNVRIVPGVVPDTFEAACPERISLLHIDMNSAASEVAALEHLFDRVAVGGIIVFDDYGWRAYAAQKTAEDAFMAQRGQHILELPTGQGLLVKQRPPSPGKRIARPPRLGADAARAEAGRKPDGRTTGRA